MDARKRKPNHCKPLGKSYISFIGAMSVNVSFLLPIPVWRKLFLHVKHDINTTFPAIQPTPTVNLRCEVSLIIIKLIFLLTTNAHRRPSLRGAKSKIRKICVFETFNQLPPSTFVASAYQPRIIQIILPYKPHPQ